MTTLLFAKPSQPFRYNGIEVSSIRGLYPKDNAELLNWIAQDKSLYLDKEKIQTLINQQQINLAEVEYLDLDLLQSKIKDFVNPKLSGEKISKVMTPKNTSLDEVLFSIKVTHNSPYLLKRAVSTGFPNMPIELSASHLANKAKTAHHPFDVLEVTNLPQALQKPIAVFEYGNKTKAQNAIIELMHNGKNFVVGVHFNQNRNRLI